MMEKIESLLKEAKVYHTQGLLEQSEQKYAEILRVIHDSKEYSMDESLIHSVNENILAVKADLDEIACAPDTPELAEEIQDLIGNLFSYSKSKEIAAIEGAVALAKFGQVEKAIAELNGLIDDGILPITAAKNMLRCQLTFSSPDKAVDQFMKWSSQNKFNVQELKDLKSFLEKILEKGGIKVDLAFSADAYPDNMEFTDMEEVLEISSIRTCLDFGPLKGREVDLDVTFQVGNKVSFIIKSDERKLVDCFRPGIRLSRLQCYSVDSVFNARGIILEKKKITSGPKRGDYSFDLNVEDP